MATLVDTMSKPPANEETVTLEHALKTGWLVLHWLPRRLEEIQEESTTIEE